MKPLRRFFLVFAVACLLSVVLTAQAASCPFCEGSLSETLVLQIDSAQMVFFGHFEKARRTNTGLEQGESDFVIERVYKDHESVKGLKRITIPKYITDSKSKWLLFGEFYKGKFDANKGTQVTHDSEMIRYVEGIIKLKSKSQPERLRYAFDFLNSPELEVSMDAYREFHRADYRDYKEMARKLPPDTIAGWLQDPKTPSYRYGLYASLLGHCGKAPHAKLLMEMIEDPEKRRGSGLHGLMSAYMMLEPKKGWTYVKDLVQSADKPFLIRYAGLQTIRFIREYRLDLLNPKDEKAAQNEIVKGVAGIMKIPDMADFAIEDMRKWKRWEYCDQILGMFGQKGFSSSVIRKSILRYALQCDTPAARAFCKAQRLRDQEWFDEVRELLELESPSATTKK
ncbi:MAG: hypothetical protein HYX68_03955 [Planctomycetes bacterium]|jgi:hypothetical protein|nr:hypothetical protein [Planctomycetota bacterium]